MLKKSFVFFWISGVLFAAEAERTAKWDTFLKEYATVKGAVTTVDYKAIKAKPAALLDYVKDVEAVTKENYKAFSENEKLAFLINAYNALTIKLIVDNYPVKSIKDIGSLFSSAWKKKVFRILGEENHLDGIEHETIRKNFKEPRIHFACVCASKGCPQLRAESYVGSRLDAQLEDQVTRFLKDPSRNSYDEVKNEFLLSKLFKWYKDDFVAQAGSVQAFVAKRMARNPQEEARMKTAEVDTGDYDWTLNESLSKKLSSEGA